MRPAAGCRNRASVTRRYLFGVSRRPHPPDPTAGCGLGRQPQRHGLDVAFPIGCFTAVTRRIGFEQVQPCRAGAADLVAEGVGRNRPPAHRGRGRPAFRRHRGYHPRPCHRRAGPYPPPCAGRPEAHQPGAPRSNLAHLWQAFRPCAAAVRSPPRSPPAMGQGASRSSVAQGRCRSAGESRHGGTVVHHSVYAPCATCKGSRYNPRRWRSEWNGRNNIAQVLDAKRSRTPARLLRRRTAGLRPCRS